MKKLTVYIMVLVLSFVLLAACAPARRPAPGTTPVPGSPRQTRVVPGPTTPIPVPTPTVPGPANRMLPRTAPARPAPVPAPTGNMDLTARSKRIANEVAKEKEIKSATVVLMGTTALVGVEFEKQYKGTMTNTIKKMVDRRVKAADTRIKRVAVTADPNLLTRIKTLAADIEKGKPLTGLTKEIEEIIRRIIPG